MIDRWETNEEGFNLEIDGTKFQLWTNVGFWISWTTNVCGNTSPDLGAVTLRAKIFHTASTLTVKFYSGFSLDAYDESWGVRDLKMRFA